MFMEVKQSGQQTILLCIFEAGIEHWGHTPDDEILFAALNQQMKS